MSDTVGKLTPLDDNGEVTLDPRVREMFEVHGEMMKLHTRAIACHCECLGMNAENSLAVCNNHTPPYNDISYDQVMQKWGLIDKQGNPQYKRRRESHD